MAIRTVEPGVDVEMAQSHEIETRGARFTIEYRTQDVMLAASAAEDVAAVVEAQNDEAPATIREEAVAVYWALVHALFPQYAGYDEPWEVTPLVVSAETGDDDNTTQVHLGSFR